jgi:hypothetical protein
MKLLTHNQERRVPNPPSYISEDLSRPPGGDEPGGLNVRKAVSGYALTMIGSGPNESLPTLTFRLHSPAENPLTSVVMLI